MLSQMSAIPNLEELIRRSHARSARYGLDPHLDGAPEAGGLSAAGLRKRINGQREFFDLARAQIDTLYGLLKGTGFCMALADSEGYVLYVVGDAELVEHFKRRRCLPGYRWLERDVGTCAIGLALEEKVPVFLPGDAMFSAEARRLSNAGAPVFAPDGGAVLGAISLSGESAMMHVHTLGLVRQAAETVTSQLRERERMRDLATTNQYLRALIESDSRGIVTVDSHGHIASFDPICMSNGEVAGGLLTVQEKKEVMGMAVEVTGSHAHFTFDSILGSSACLGQALRHARIAAASTAPVLLCGETGTGKELFAQAIHNGGERRNRPFVAINCGAIPKELLESELFGYEEGAFAGARKGGRPGKFELADSGTLFLDEIGDMPFDMQVKLLRVLQTGEIQRVGGLRTVPVDLRVISATNKDLRQAIEQQKFRADLYYRISTLNILVPPLRERPEDILPLAEYFIQRHRLRLNKPTAVLPPDTAAMLTAHAWPGNVRQLESAVERAMHLAEGGDLLAEHFGIAGLERPRQAAPSEPSGGTGQGTLEDLEQRAVAEALARHNGTIRAASESSAPVLHGRLIAKMRRSGSIATNTSSGWAFQLKVNLLQGRTFQPGYPHYPGFTYSVRMP